MDLVLCCYLTILFANKNSIANTFHTFSRIRQVAPVCTLGPWVSRVNTQRRLHHFLTVQLFYNSCAQIIHRIRQVAPLCTAM